MHNIQIELRKLAKPEKIPIYKNFFKTGDGEYGEGDEFIGVTVPDSRKVAKANVDISLEDLVPIIESRIHEERFCAFIILVLKFEKTKPKQEKKQIVDFYIRYHLYGNNWDLVDNVSYKILGPWLFNKEKSILYEYAYSSNLWEQRIAIITTLHFIRLGEFEDTIRISEILLNGKHDLIQKAVGWMLREVGKRDEKELINFLDKHFTTMPRTMLRYATERLPPQIRKVYLTKK